MKTSLAAFVCGLILASVAWSFQDVVKRSHYTDEVYGFSIDAPRFPDVATNTGSIPVAFTGISQSGGASNVNVMVQAVAKTRKEYREFSLAQMKRIGLKVNSDRDVTISDRDAMEIDYEGKIGGFPLLHFLALAVIEKDRVILITCTASPQAFPAVEAEFRACLASFRLKDANP